MNKKIAVMVDAGYFCAQASEVVFGRTMRRDEFDIDEKQMVLAMEEMAKHIFDADEVLRVYWYDAPPGRGQLSDSQARLGMLEGVKLRLGKLNGSGQQKLVDALLCHDLEELARNKAVDCILLVTGDEDLLHSVEFAQSHGVQVKLLGIGPGAASIGQDMAMASDGVRRLSKEGAETLLTLHSGASPRQSGPSGESAKKRPSRAKDKKAPASAAKSVQAQGHSAAIPVDAPRHAELAVHAMESAGAQDSPAVEAPPRDEGRQVQSPNPNSQRQGQNGQNGQGGQHAQGNGNKKRRNKRNRGRDRDREGRPEGSAQHRPEEHQSGAPRDSSQQGQGQAAPAQEHRREHAAPLVESAKRDAPVEVHSAPARTPAAPVHAAPIERQAEAVSGAPKQEPSAPATEAKPKRAPAKKVAAAAKPKAKAKAAPAAAAAAPASTEAKKPAAKRASRAKKVDAPSQG